MLRKANELDKEPILSFLKEEASFNTFLIGDILTYGFDNPMQKVYINEGELDLVVIVYFTTMLLYQKSNKVYDLSLIFNSQEVKTIMGKNEHVELYEFNDFKKITKYFMELKTNINYEGEYQVASVDDGHKLAEFYMTIDEFVSMYHSYEEVKRMITNRISSKEGRHYFLEDNDKVISQINSAAENPYSAIIGGVATSIDYRKQGYATNLLKSLCTSLQKEGMIPCLFYDNEEAGKIYKNVGFDYIGDYAFLNKIN